MQPTSTVVCRNPFYRDKKKQQLKEDLSTMNKIGGVSHFWFTSLFQNLIASSTFCLMWRGKWEKWAVRGNSHCSTGVAQGGSINALVWPQLLQHIYTASDQKRSELSLAGNKFLNKNLSSLYDMRIKLINGENYCIVKLQQWGHCDNYWIFIQLIFLEEF